MLYRDIEVEKFWDLPSTDKRKKEKIHSKIMTGTYGATIKKDGEYLRLIYDNDGEIFILGRGTNAKEVHNLKLHLPWLTYWLETNFDKGTCILGELYVPGETSRAIRKYTGSLVKKSLAEQAKCMPKFYIFDVWAVNGINHMNSTYATRMEVLRRIRENSYNYNSQIEYATVVEGTTAILDFIAEAFENGEEGCVLVDLDSTVSPGKRTAWKSIKIKKEFQNNIDCFFTGRYIPATRDYTGKEIETWQYWENIKNGKKLTGNFYESYVNGDPIEPITKLHYLGLPGSVEVGVYKGDQIVPICFISGISEELKKQFIVNPESVSMRPIAITGMEATDASIRHPKFIGFRDDISLKDCEWGKIFGE